MKKTNLIHTAWCEAYIDNEINGLNVTWSGLISLEESMDTCREINTIIEKNNINLYYSNQLNLKVVNKKVQSFLIDAWYPKLERLGITKMAILIPLDPYAKASMEKVNQTYTGIGKMEIFKFGFEKECHNWLKINRARFVEGHSLDQKISAFQLLKVDEEVKKLDPLSFDQHLKTIPKLNAEKDIKGLVNILYQILPNPAELIEYDFYTALAAMRDIGMLLGSIKRHGKEPIDVVPELEFILDELSLKSTLPPRDTLLHYTVWNPDGDRMRKYTDHEDENGLILSVKMAMPSLEGAIDQLIKLHHTPMESSEFQSLCEQASKQFKTVVDAMVLAHRTVSPEVFAKELRFYFDPIQFNDQELIGPGAVEMPMFLFDHLLWSSTVDNEIYTEFKTKYLPYNLPFINEIYQNYEGKPSLVDLAISKMSENKSTQVFASANALLKLCNLQKSFRKPHKKLADESYKHQEETGKSKGSGGYSTDILSVVMHHNNNQIERLKSCVMSEKTVNRK